MSEQTIVAATPPPIFIVNGAPTINDSHDLRRVASLLLAAGWADKNLTRPEQVMCAIMHGQALGLNPMQAAQGIAVINGRPTAWGDTLVAVVRASGQLEYMTEKLDGEGDRMVATCTVKRKNEPEPVVSSFSATDAKKAGLWGKAGPWSNYPQRMLKLRARGFALRDTFADILRGVSMREEVMDEPGEGTNSVRAAVAQVREAKPLMDANGRVVAESPPPPAEIHAGKDAQEPSDEDELFALEAAAMMEADRRK